MRSAFASALRGAARAALPEGAFLRRDRGDALFVSDAPRLCPGADLAEALSRAGFRCAIDGGLARLYPGEIWLTRLEAEFPEPPDALCRSLRLFAALPPEEESLRLFTLGLRALDGEACAALYDRRLRQRAAQCLRLNRTGPQSPARGGGLYACALLASLLKEDE